MALIKCKACSREVSKSADKCPHCGEPLKRKPIGFFGAIVFIGLFVVLGTIISGQSSTAPKTSATPAPKITADCSIQDGRKKAIQKLIDQGYWQKIERPGDMTRVSVMPLFTESTTLDDKKSFISVASAYDVCMGGNGTVRIIDAMNGKDLGYFSEYGLNWKE